MTEVPSDDFPWTGPNDDRRPLTPEQELQNKFGDLFDAVAGHYMPDFQGEMASNSHAPWREIRRHSFPDGTVRDVIDDKKTGEQTTKIYLSGAVVDSNGRRVLLETTQPREGGATYDIRFLGTAVEGPTIYRWSANGPVTVVQDRRASVSLVPDTGPFQRAAKLVDQLEGRWQTLVQNQRGDKSIKVGSVAARLAGLVGGFFTR